MKTPLFISIQGSYSQLQLSLFKGNSCLTLISETNKKASSLMVPLIEEMLKQHSLTLCDINFICADQGPGAFTSLRVTIATINGISFAQHIPLIGIDGLDALAQETHKRTHSAQTSPLLSFVWSTWTISCISFFWCGGDRVWSGGFDFRIGYLILSVAFE